MRGRSRPAITRLYAGGVQISPERFRALARSSPWRWSTLRYVHHELPEGRGQDPIRVWLRRLKLARIEHLDGSLRGIRRDHPLTVAALSRRGRATPVPVPGPDEVEVDLDDDGLVRQRPGPAGVDADAPMIGNYYHVALLDPVELADGYDDGPGAHIEQLREVDHHSRPAWEAVLRPTATYIPRCQCCSLLLGIEPLEGGLDLRSVDPDFVFPDAHLVRLDVQTGVCVTNEHIGGTRAGWGHDITIEAVDIPMDDDLFPAQPRSRWARLIGRR
jgi:hypothetical protein